MEDTDSSDEEITLVDIVAGSSLTWRVPDHQMVKLSMKRKGGKVEQEGVKKLKEDRGKSNHPEEINVQLKEFQEKLTRLVEEEEEKKYLKSEGKMMEEGADEPIICYDHQLKVSTTPTLRATTADNKSPQKTVRKPPRKASITEVPDVTETYSSGEEEGECRVCCRADPPPRRRRGRAEVVWAGCDCGAWYHLECTDLATVRRDFTCAALNRDCSLTGTDRERR